MAPGNGNSAPKGRVKMRLNAPSVSEWLSHSERYVNRGELWFWLNYYEGQRRKASPFYAFLKLVKAIVSAPIRWFKRPARIDPEQPVTPIEPSALTIPLPEQPAPSRKRFDAAGRIIDE